MLKGNYNDRCEKVIVNNLEDCVLAVKELQKKCNDIRVLGMDCEWRSDKNAGPCPVALLQLATLDGYCSLFRLCKIGHVPQCLSDILSDSTIIKTGVAVTGDASRLLNDYGVRCGGCLDLRYMAKDQGLTALGLGKMSLLYLGVELDKNWRIRCSNWEALELDDKQTQYAALDAFMSVLLFEYFNNIYLRETYSLLKRLFWTNRDMWEHTVSHWCIYTSLAFSEKSYSWQQRNMVAESCPRISGGKEASGNKLSSPPSTSNSRSFSTRAFRKTPLYHNIFVQAPDGMVLCTCDRKKADWYLKREMAFVVNEEPLTLRLKFEPAGRTGGGEGYYAKTKDNKCVVCGSTKLMCRKSIVPHEYRKYFPVGLKKHSSHDVLLLCHICHDKSQFHDQQLRLFLAGECDAAFSDNDNNKFIRMGADLLKVRSAARAILKCADTIPEARRVQLESTIVDFLRNAPDDQTDECCLEEIDNMEDGIQLDTGDNKKLTISKENLVELANLPKCVENVNYEPHGFKVVEYYKLKGDKPEMGINLLEKLWRNNFVTRMSPKYLPELWSVDYNHYQCD